MPSFESVYAWSQSFYLWSKDWQYLLAGLLAVLAACIFAIGSITAARIRASASRSSARYTDLRVKKIPIHSEPTLAAPSVLTPFPLQPVFSSQDISGNLDHLRWLIRTGLSPQLSSDVSQTSLIGCCERVEKMRLENVPLSDGATEAARIQRKVMLQDANTLRELADTQAASSEIISALIKLNTSARELTALLKDETADGPSVANLSG